MTTETKAQAREWRIGGAVQRWPAAAPHTWIDEVGDEAGGISVRRWVAETRTREDAEQLIRRRAAANALVAALEGLLAVYGYPCRLDHEGYCQAHNVGRPCEVAEARLALAQAYGETESAPGATPRPWYAGPNYLIGGWWVSREPEPEKQGSPGAEIADSARQEDAEFIARAANAHDALVAALEAYLEPAGDTPKELRTQGLAALALVRAKGRPS